jgi:hypothetical protein
LRRTLVLLGILLIKEESFVTVCFEIQLFQITAGMVLQEQKTILR